MECAPVWLDREPPKIFAEAERVDSRLAETLSMLALDSRRVVEDGLERFLRSAREASAKGTSEILFVVGVWGYGKTHTVLHELPRVAERVLGSRLCIARLPVMDLIARAEEAVERDENVTDAVYQAMLEKLEAECKSQEPSSKESSSKELSILFLDELEALLQAPGRVSHRAVLQTILNVVKSLLDPDSRGYPELRGKTHIVVAATPEAYAEFTRFARDMGVWGWMERRMHILDLVPLSRLDALLIIESVLREYVGLDDPWSIIDKAFVDVAWMLSRGNTGLLLRLLDEFIYTLYIECTRRHGRPCICRCDRITLLKILARLSTPVGGGSATLVARECIEELERLEALDVEVAEAYASLLLMQPIDSKHWYVIDGRVSKCKPGVVHVRVYKLGSGDLTGLVAKAFERLSVRSDRALPASIEKAVLTLPLRVGSDALIVPVEGGSRRLYDSDLRYSLRLYRVQPSEAHLDTLEEVAGGSPSVKVYEALVMSPSSYHIVYSVVLPALHFLVDDETAAQLLDRVEELARRDPGEYLALASEGLALALREAGVAVESADRSGVLRLRYAPYGGVTIEYRVRFEVVPQGERIEPSIEPRLYFRVSTGARPEVREPQALGSELHATLLVDVVLPRGTASTLAAAAEALREHPHLVDRDALSSELKRIVTLLREAGLDNALDKAARMFYERGVFVQTEPRLEKSTLNALKSFSLVMDENKVVDVEKLARFLHAVLRVTPYHGKDRKWCDRYIPPLLRVDVEPSSGTLEELKSNIDSMIVSEVRKSGLFEELPGVTAYRLRLPPDAERIVKLVERLGAVRLDELLGRYLLLPWDRDRAEAAKARLRAIVEYLASIDVLVYDQRRGVLKPAKWDLQDLRLKLDERYQRLVEEAYRVLNEYVSFAGSEDAGRRLASLIVGKKKQVKLIRVEDIIDAANAAREVAKSGSVFALKTAIQVVEMLSSLVEALREKLEFAKERFAGISRRVGEALGLASRAEGRLRKLGVDVRIDLERELRKPSVGELVENALRVVEAAGGGVGRLKSLIGEDDYRVFFYYDSCGEEKHSALTYAVVELEKRFESLTRGWQVTAKLHELDQLINSVEHDQAAIEVLREAIGGYAYPGVDGVSHIVDEVKRVLERVESERRRIEELKREVAELEERVEALKRELEGVIAEARRVEERLRRLGKKPPVQTPRIDTSDITRLESVEGLTLEERKRLLEDAVRALRRRVEEARGILERLRKEERAAREAAGVLARRVGKMLRDLERVAYAEIGRSPALAKTLAELKEAEELLQRIERGEAEKDLGAVERQVKEGLARLEELVRRVLEERAGQGAYEVYKRLASMKHRARLYEIIARLSQELGLGENEVLRILYNLDKLGYLSLDVVVS